MQNTQAVRIVWIKRANENYKDKNSDEQTEDPDESSDCDSKNKKVNFQGCWKQIRIHDWFHKLRHEIQAYDRLQED